MRTAPFSLRLTAEMRSRLEAEAKQEERSASSIATQAIETWLDRKAAKRSAVDVALEEADKGIFVSSEAMHRWMQSWGTATEISAPEPDIFPAKS